MENEEVEKMRAMVTKQKMLMLLAIKWALAICAVTIIMGIGAIVSSYFLIRLSKTLSGVDWPAMFNLGIFTVMIAIAWRIAMSRRTRAH